MRGYVRWARCLPPSLPPSGGGHVSAAVHSLAAMLPYWHVLLLLAGLALLGAARPSFRPIPLPTDFASYDLNGDAAIQVSELANVSDTSEAEASKPFLSADTNHDGLINAEEFHDAPWDLQGTLGTNQEGKDEEEDQDEDDYMDEEARTAYTEDDDDDDNVNDDDDDDDDDDNDDNDNDRDDDEDRGIDGDDDDDDDGDDDDANQ